MNRFALIFLTSLLVAGRALAQNSGTTEPDQLRVRIPLGPVAGENVWMLQDGPAQERAAQKVFFWKELSVAGDQEVIKNAPFTGTVVNESTQTLSDGNRIINKSSGFQARDSQGRTRREETLEKVGPLQVEAPKMILISDPVAHVNYVLQPDERTVHTIRRDEEAVGNTVVLKKKLEDLTNRIEAGAGERHRKVGASEETKVDVRHEDLGMQDVEGVACHGARETVTIPAGEAGNERPIMITTETWTSDDLHGIVLKKHNDPRYGETVYRLINIKLGEPDASLFQPPSNFKPIKFESSFTFNKD